MINCNLGTGHITCEHQETNVSLSTRILTCLITEQHPLHGTTMPRHTEVDLIAHRQTEKVPLQSVQFNYILLMGDIVGGL